MFVLLPLFVINCAEQQLQETPFVKTAPVTNILANSFTTGGEVVTDGGSDVTSRGICWSVKQNPVVRYKDSTANSGSGKGVFASSLTKLQQGATYYVRAFATNATGTGYGNQVSAVLPASLPTVSTTPITAVSDKIVNTGGNITSDGGSLVFARGVCWATTANPTLDNSYTTQGIGSGIFTSTISQLNPDSLYFLRAYATNSVGTTYGNSYSFTGSKLSVKDKDGNFYHFVTIGSQIWMVENLKTTRFNDSTLIPTVEFNNNWSNLITAAYSWYNGDQITNKNKYGALYNWYAVSSGKLCPAGWHVPADDEWLTLAEHLGGFASAGGKLKEKSLVYWKSPNSGASNETLFTALPGGYRLSTGEYGNAGSYGYWWSSTGVSFNVSNYLYLYYANAALTKSFINQKYGLSVRCIKD